MKVFAVAICALAVLSVVAGQARAPARAPSSGAITDIDILNFALQLEYLEAEFYSCAATGSPLPDDLRGGGPPSTGCRKANLGTDAQALAVELAADETAHVRLLRTALGSQAVPAPQMNIGTAFAAAANAAFGATLTPAFSPYLNDLFFYHGAFIFEDVGVSAYYGAAPLIRSPQILTSAAGILPIEAYHAGTARTILFQRRNQVTPYNVTVAEIVDAISELRAMLGGGNDEGIETENGGANVALTNPQGLAYARTPSQVLNIVTFGTPSGGGFFPRGLNGALAASASRR